MDVKRKNGWLPTKKWLAAQAVALGAIAVSWIESGWDAQEERLLVAWAVQAAVTWLVPNKDTPGGVPDAEWQPTKPFDNPPKPYQETDDQFQKPGTTYQGGTPR